MPEKQVADGETRDRIIRMKETLHLWFVILGLHLRLPCRVGDLAFHITLGHCILELFKTMLPCCSRMVAETTDKVIDLGLVVVRNIVDFLRIGTVVVAV